MGKGKGKPPKSGGHQQGRAEATQVNHDHFSRPESLAPAADRQGHTTKPESVLISQAREAVKSLRLKVESGAPSPLAKEEEDTLSHQDSADRELARMHSNEELEEKKANRKLRQKTAHSVFRFMYIWSALLWGLIFIVGFKSDFQFDSKVLITLIGGSSVSVIGLVGFVIKGLFSNGSTNGNSGSKPKKK